MFFRKAFVEDFAIFTREHLRWSLFLIKLKRDSNAGAFLLILRKTPILKTSAFGCLCKLDDIDTHDTIYLYYSKTHPLVCMSRPSNKSINCKVDYEKYSRNRCGRCEKRNTSLSTKTQKRQMKTFYQD